MCTVASSVTSCSDSGLTSGANYAYAIKAVLGNWQSSAITTSGTTLAADGSGTLTTPTSSVFTSSTGNTITFTYTAATGGVNTGSVTLVVPAGWSVPSTTGSAAGFTTASLGGGSVSRGGSDHHGFRRDVVRRCDWHDRVRKQGIGWIGCDGDRDGWRGDVEDAREVDEWWDADEHRDVPIITVATPANGSGTMTTPTSSVFTSSTGNTITFTYTAATGGVNNGSVTLVVPAGWSARLVTSGSAAGFTTASLGGGSVSRGGADHHGCRRDVVGRCDGHDRVRKQDIGWVGCDGDRDRWGAQTWQAQEKSTTGGTLTNLAIVPINHRRNWTTGIHLSDR